MQLTAAGATMAAAFACLYFLVLTIPLISLYLARVYKNQVYRPMFIVDRTRTCL
jgi:membrane-anchored glycerophosphoryl diester phosphodiesterase (GDPDase)